MSDGYKNMTMIDIASWQKKAKQARTLGEFYSLIRELQLTHSVTAHEAINILDNRLIAIGDLESERYKKR